MDDILRITLLYDFYGELLTHKQKNVFELYYQNDLSLAEIAEQFQISRQGVYDILKRSENILTQYEETLHLVERFLENKHSIKEMIQIMDEMEKNFNDPQKIKSQIIDMKNIAYKILDE